MKDNLIIHIGLGKAASSSLQAKIFPLISKNLGYYHISNKSPINNQIDLNLKNLMTKHVTNMIYHLTILLQVLDGISSEIQMQK